jgi:hypothetical protein
MFKGQNHSSIQPLDHRVRIIRDAATRATGIAQRLRTMGDAFPPNRQQSSETQQASPEERSISQLISIIAALAAEAEHSAEEGLLRRQEAQASSDLRHLPLELTQNCVLDTTEASAFCGFSVAHWRRLYRTGKVPKPIRLSTRKLGW